MQVDKLTELLITKEMFNPVLFKKLFHVWRASQFKTRIIPLTKKIQLPLNSCLHILDNAGHTNFQDIPRIEENHFIQNERYKQFIMHASNFQFTEDDPIHIDVTKGTRIDSVDNALIEDIEKETDISLEHIFLNTRDNKLNELILYLDNYNISNEKIVTSNKGYIFQRAGLNANLLKFRNNYGSRFRYISTIDDIPTRKDILTIVNHNPLFRVQTKGTLKYFKKIQLIMSSILNTCCKITTKNNFILIPFSTEIYQRAIFQRSEFMLNAATIRNSESFHFIFMMNLINYVNRKSNTSIFDLVPENNRTNINFIIQTKDNVVIYNMADIYEIVENTNMVLRMINQLNSLALTGIETKSDKINIQVSKLLEDKKQKDIDLDEVGIELDEKITSDTVDVKIKPPKNEKTVIDEVEYKQDEDTASLIEDISKELNELDRIPFILDPITTVKPKTIVSIYDDPTNNVVIPDIELDFNGKDIEVDSTPTYKREVKILSYMDELDKSSSELINNTPGLTVKQKERLLNTSTVYKDLVFKSGNTEVTFAELLNEKIDDKLDDNYLDFLKDDILDKSMLKSKIVNMDIKYMQSSFKRDLAATCVSFAKNGMFLTDFEVKPMFNELNRVSEYRITYEDLKGKKHTTKFTIPEVDKNGHCYVNGVNKIFKKQMVNLPICKISPTKVALSSSYNKARVTRELAKSHSFNFYILKILKDPKFYFELGRSDVKIPIAYEYSSLMEKLKIIKFTDIKTKIFYRLVFDYHHRFEYARKSDIEKLQLLEKQHGILFGFMHNNNYLFINLNNEITKINTDTDLVEPYIPITDIILSGTDQKITKLSEWVNFEYMGKKYPIVFILGYKFGLKNILDYIGCSYELYFKEVKAVSTENIKSEKPKLNPTDIVIDFQDVKLVINRYPLTQYLIVSGLKHYELKNYNFEDLNTPDPYYDLLLDKKISIHNFKGIDMFFELFMDAKTREVLIKMNEPTNVKDLLIRAVAMLTTEHAHEASAMKNHRLRSYERFNSIVYNALARRLADVKNRPGRGMKFSVNPFQIYNEIITDQAMITVDSINPIQDIKERCSFTYVGAGGRSKDSFVINDRIYPDDATGIISESTVDSGDVAINAMLTVDPTIVDSKGTLVTRKVEDLEPTELFSVTALLMPCSTNDDNARINFINIQMSHHVPTVESSVSRIRTGYEKIVAHRCSDNFAAIARNNGKVVEVNDVARMIKVVYEDNSSDVFIYGEEQNVISDGICISQKIKKKANEGDIVKKGDVLCYNEEFFEEDPYSSQVSWKHGVNANIALIETSTTLEDSNLVTSRLASKLVMKPTEMSRPISMDKNTLVHKIVKEGDFVENTDILMQFENADFESFDSVSSGDYLMGVLSKLDQHMPKAKHTGTVIKIEVLYSCPISEMHPSLAKIVKEVNKLKTERSRFAKNTEHEHFNFNPQPLPEGTKYKGILLDPDNVIFIFYIRQEIPFEAGDKCVFGNQMKSVSCKSVNDEIVSESGVQVDGLFSATSLSKRIVLSTQLVGIGNRILEKMENDVLDMYFN